MLAKLARNRAPDYVQHFSDESDSPTWAEHDSGEIEQWWVAPDGTIAANTSTLNPSGGSVPVTDSHGDNTATLRLQSTTKGTINTANSYDMYDEYGNQLTNAPDPVFARGSGSVGSGAGRSGNGRAGVGAPVGEGGQQFGRVFSDRSTPHPDQ